MLLHRLQGTQVLAFSLHPGVIDTPLTRHSPWWVPVAMALGRLLRMLGAPWLKTVEQVGRVGCIASTN